jgi:hypothetical protein
MIETGPKVGKPIATDVIRNRELSNADTRYTWCKEIVNVALAEIFVRTNCAGEVKITLAVHPFVNHPFLAGETSDGEHSLPLPSL